MLLREMVAVETENNKKRVNELCGKNAELVKVAYVENIVTTVL
jgi:translation initiation factor IF-1